MATPNTTPRPGYCGGCRGTLKAGTVGLCHRCTARAARAALEAQQAALASTPDTAVAPETTTPRCVVCRGSFRAGYTSPVCHRQDCQDLAPSTPAPDTAVATPTPAVAQQAAPAPKRQSVPREYRALARRLYPTLPVDCQGMEEGEFYTSVTDELPGFQATEGRSPREAAEFEAYMNSRAEWEAYQAAHPLTAAATPTTAAAPSTPTPVAPETTAVTTTAAAPSTATVEYLATLGMAELTALYLKHHPRLPLGASQSSLRRALAGTGVTKPLTEKQQAKADAKAPLRSASAPDASDGAVKPVLNKAVPPVEGPVAKPQCDGAGVVKCLVLDATGKVFRAATLEEATRYAKALTLAATAAALAAAAPKPEQVAVVKEAVVDKPSLPVNCCECKGLFTVATTDTTGRCKACREARVARAAAKPPVNQAEQSAKVAAALAKAKLEAEAKAAVMAQATERAAQADAKAKAKAKADAAAQEAKQDADDAPTPCQCGKCKALYLPPAKCGKCYPAPVSPAVKGLVAAIMGQVQDKAVPLPKAAAPATPAVTPTPAPAPKADAAPALAPLTEAQFAGLKPIALHTALKRACKARGLETTGKTPELRERLGLTVTPVTPAAAKAVTPVVTPVAPAPVVHPKAGLIALTDGKGGFYLATGSDADLGTVFTALNNLAPLATAKQAA